MSLLLQYSSFASCLSNSALTSLLHFLHISLPPYYMAASEEAIMDRLKELYAMWKKQIGNTISQTFIDTTVIMNEMNTWISSIPRNGWKCSICEYGNSNQDKLCKICGSSISDSFTNTNSNRIMSTKLGAESISGSLTPTTPGTMNEMNEDDENIYRSWNFDNTIVFNSDAPIKIIGNYSYKQITIENKTKSVLFLPKSSYLDITQPLGYNGTGTYLNIYTLIIDFMIPNFKQQKYSALFQPDSLNTHPASLFVVNNGSIGCINYSQSNVITNTSLQRLVLSVDLTQGLVIWYIDGKEVGRIVHNPDKQCVVIEDDRWSLEDHFLIGIDCKPVIANDLYISAIQLRSTFLSALEISRLGSVTFDGPAKPDKADLTSLLMTTTKLPYSFCSIGITESKTRSIQVITNWIKANEKNIIKILAQDVKALVKLGYKQDQSIIALLNSSSRTEALSLISSQKLSNDVSLLQPYIKQLESILTETDDATNKSSHPGIYTNGVWTCCQNTKSDCPACTMTPGRVDGIIAKGNRVVRGPHWKWLNQDGGEHCFGTVSSITNWDIYPSKGIIVRWDNGFYGKYRWGVNNCFDLYIIGELSVSKDVMTVNSIGGDSGLENPSYEILTSSKLEEKVNKNDNSVLPALDDLEEEEIFKEIAMASSRICSTYSQSSLVSFISSTSTSSNEDVNSSSTQNTDSSSFGIKDIFMQENCDTLREFITAFLHHRKNQEDTSANDNTNISILQKQLDSYLRQEVDNGTALYKKNVGKPDQAAVLYDFWKNSFANKYSIDLLTELSLLAQPKGSSASFTLPLSPCSNYSMVAILPEHNISFWNPIISDAYVFCTVMKSSSGQSISTPPSFSTSVLPYSLIPLLKNCKNHLSKAVGIELICTIESLSVGKVSFWRLKCPIGFVSFGCIVSKGSAPPPYDNYICISKKISRIGQVEKNLSANSKNITSHTFYNTNSLFNHFYVSQDSSYPEPGSIFILEGEETKDSTSIDTIKWMCDIITSIYVKNNCMGVLKSFVFSNQLLTGLNSCLEALESNRLDLLYVISSIFYSASIYSFSQSQANLISALSKNLEVLYENEKESGLFSPSFQCILETLVSVELMCYDNEHDANDSVIILRKYLSQQKFFQEISRTAIVLSALSHRKTRMIPQHYLLKPYLLDILIQLRDSKLIETEHPYTETNRFVTVDLDPSASGALVRFEGTPSSEEDDVFAFYSNQNIETPLLLLSGKQYPKDVIKIKENYFNFVFPLKNPVLLSWSVVSNSYASYDPHYVCISSKLNNEWLSISTKESFNNGISSWCYYIHKLTNQNMCFGISVKPLAAKLYLGSNNYTWGYTATGYLYYEGKRKQFGPGIKVGDTLKMILNHKKCSLTITINNIFIGVAFYNIPTNTSIYPSVSLYNSGDIVQIIHGNHVQLDYSKPSPKIVDISDNIKNMDNSSEEWLSHVPQKRLESAKNLATMGYDIYSCVLALERNSDNYAYATDYIISNTEELKEETKELCARNEQHKQEMKEEEEIKWMIDAYCSESRNRCAKKLQWTCKRCNTINMADSAECRVCKNKKPLEDEQLSEDDQKVLNNRWGFRLHITPVYDKTELENRKQHIMTNHSQLIKNINNWTLEQDEALIEMISEICTEKVIDPIDFFPGDLVPSDKLMMKYTSLGEFALPVIQIRFSLLQSFNQMIKNGLPFFNISKGKGISKMADDLRRVRGLLFRSVKTTWFDKALEKSICSDKNNVILDRNAARLVQEQHKIDTNAKFTIFGQLYQLLNMVPPQKLHHPHQPLYVSFKGEMGDDCGGLCRETLTSIAPELESGLVPLFIISPNGRNNLGYNKDVYIPDPNATSKKSLSMYEFLGKLFGISIRTKMFISLNMAPAIWKLLVGISIDMNDIISIDDALRQKIDDILEYEVDSTLTEDQWNTIAKENHYNYTVLTSNGISKELFPGGKDVFISINDKKKYINMIIDYRKNEFVHQTEAIARGIATQVPRHLLNLFTWKELKSIICGESSINLELLKQNTEYGEGLTQDSKCIQYFWQTLENFNNEERELYLRFVWGKTRLPLDSSGFDHKHIIHLQKQDNPDNYFPLSHTCFFTLDLPEYTSYEKCHNRILYAIRNCQAIDGDDTQAALRAYQMTQATSLE